MKKYIMPIVAVLCILCLCSCTQKAPVSETVGDASQTETLTDKLLREIEGEYFEKQAEPQYTTTAGMVKLSVEYASKWEAVAEEYYAKILEWLSKNSPEVQAAFEKKLSELKETYAAYAEAKTEVYTEAYQILYGGGSIRGPLSAHRAYDIKKDFALELAELYEILTFDR